MRDGQTQARVHTQKKSPQHPKHDDPAVQRRQAEFRERIGRINPRRLIFIDETGTMVDMMRRHGYAPKGLRLKCKHRGKSKLWSLIGGISLARGLHGLFVFEGWMTRQDFEQWVIDLLLPTLGPGDVVVLDNARIHDSDLATATIESVGAEVLFLPPYTPEYNPIEECWSKLKAVLRELRPQDFDALCAAISEAQACMRFDDILGWFGHSGLDVSRCNTMRSCCPRRLT